MESEIQRYMENIEDEEYSVDALFTGVGSFDLAVLATDEELYRPKVKIVDFDYPEWGESARRLAPKLQSELSEWTYQFEGENRDYSGSEADPSYSGQIYLADSVDENRLDEFSQVFFGDAEVWRYLDEIHEIQ